MTHDIDLVQRVLHMSHADLQMEVVRLTATLHSNLCHPDYDYCFSLPNMNLGDTGWEPNPDVDASVVDYDANDKCWRKRKESS